MDQNETQDRQFAKSDMLKKITRLLLSVSLISFVLSNNLSLLSFIHSLNVYFSTFPGKLFSHAIDKNCIFLVCNGLLVFVAKYSGLLASSSSSKYGSSSNYKSFHDYEDVVSQPSESELRVLEKEALAESTADGQNRLEKHDENKIEEAQAKEADDRLNVEGEGGGEREISMAEPGEESESLVKGPDDGFLMQEDEDNDDEVEEGNGLLSTEELNKKFDEFIRKMKEEIRIESQQQLVVVN